MAHQEVPLYMRLEPEIVAAALAHLPLSTLAGAAAACREWWAASLKEPLWLAILGRQWLMGSLADLGPSFPGGARQAVRASASAAARGPGAWHPAPTSVQRTALEEMSEPARRFLFGISHGYMPTVDGLFTYHCLSATPIHYRHTPGKGTAPAYEDVPGPEAAPQLGGSWAWSPDRSNWFPTSTCSITAGPFARDGWGLIADNQAIVAFLEAWPLLPFFRTAVPLVCAGALASHEALNEEALEDFRRAVTPNPLSERPTTSCIALHVFTLHLHFLPAVQLSCTRRGWRLASLLRGQPLLHEHEELLRRLNGAMLDTGGGYAVRHGGYAARHGGMPLAAYVWAYERWLHREVLGLAVPLVDSEGSPGGGRDGGTRG